MKKFLNLLVLICLGAGAALSVSAQTDAPPPAQAYQPLADTELDQLLGPIALYPDPLIAQVLAAATLPAQIVLADRYVAGGGDPGQIEQQPWDASMQAIAHYPNVLKWLDDNLAWTTELGQAFLNQQQDVMNSVQRLRASAQNLGNLQSTPQQQVVDDGADIEIVPADPDTIYVPEYDPGVVYVDSGPFITFGIGFAIGGWLNCDFDWGHHRMIIWNHDHPRPRNWWQERGHARDAAFSGHSTVWHPANRPRAGSSRPVDRGFNNPQMHHEVPQPAAFGTHPAPRASSPRDTGTVHVGPAMGRPAPALSQHFTPPPVQREAPAARAPQPSSGAFIGIQSSQETRSYSNRGQESMGNIERSAPAQAPRSAPSAPASRSESSGGGGGGGGGGRGKR